MNTLEVDLSGKLTVKYDGRLPENFYCTVLELRKRQNAEFKAFVEDLVEKAAVTNEESYNRAMGVIR